MAGDLNEPSRHDRASFWVIVAGVLVAFGVALVSVASSELATGVDIWSNGWARAAAALWIFGAAALAWALCLKIRITTIGFQWPTYRKDHARRVPLNEPLPHFEILSAQYGAEEVAWKDVTEYLRGRIVDGRLNILASNGEFGDPCPGKIKNLKVKYRLGNQLLEDQFTESTQAVLPKATP